MNTRSRDAMNDMMTAEKVLEILKAHGTHVTLEEAKIILIYLTQLAEAEVSGYIKTVFHQ